MRRTSRLFLTLVFGAVLMTAPFVALPVTSAQATISAKSAVPECGVVANSSIRVVSVTPPCVISTVVNANVRIELRSGFRWGSPVSNSHAIVVTTISRTSIGVTAAVVHASTVGRAIVHSVGTVYCKAGVACPDLALLWSIQIIVTGASTDPWTLPVSSIDGGRTYRVRTGDTLSLTLGAQPNNTWTLPTTSAPQVLAETASAAGRRALGEFVARSVGRATVRALERPRCPGHCAPPIVGFAITVVVTS